MDEALEPPTSTPVMDDDHDERRPLLLRFPYSLVMKVSLSEPRDVLQTERTTLTFVRFATTLFFTAMGMILNFRINSSGNPSLGYRHPFSEWSSTIILFVLIVLALFTLILLGVNYMFSIRRYADHKIHTHGFSNKLTAVCVTAVVLALAAICVLFIIEGYVLK